MSEISTSNNSCPRVWGVGLLLWAYVDLVVGACFSFLEVFYTKESSQIFWLALSNSKKKQSTSQPIFHHYCFMAEIGHKPMMGPHAYNLIYSQISAAFPRSKWNLQKFLCHNSSTNIKNIHATLQPSNTPIIHFLPI